MSVTSFSAASSRVGTPSYPLLQDSPTADEVSPLRRYYTPAEIATHNKDYDCWLSWLGKVYNLTSLISDWHDGKLSNHPSSVRKFHLWLLFSEEDIKPIVAAAGSDISSWFDEASGDVSLFTLLVFHFSHWVLDESSVADTQRPWNRTNCTIYSSWKVHPCSSDCTYFQLEKWLHISLVER